MKPSITWLLMAVSSGLVIGGSIRLALEMLPLAWVPIARYVATMSERELLVTIILLFVVLLPGLAVAVVVGLRAVAPFQADIRAQYPAPPPRQSGQSRSPWATSHLVSVAVVASICAALVPGPVAALIAVGCGILIRIAVTLAAALASD
jgi:nitrate reductase NapE component